MANIQVKGINDYLLFILNDEVSDDQCFLELERLLSSPSFQKENFYVKGYFDFGKRVLTKESFTHLMAVLRRCQNVLFCGLDGANHPQRHMRHFSGIIRNGEVVTCSEDLLFEGKINPGGHLIVQGSLYCLGCIQGTIEVVGEEVCINVSDLKHACLIINDKRCEDISLDHLTVFFDDGQAISCKTEEEKVWQEQL